MNGDPNIYIPQDELDYMAKIIMDSPKIETGGNLFGYWTERGDAVIQYILGPGKEAIHDRTRFVQDADYLQIHANNLQKNHYLDHIGVWHSHHSLGLSYPSAGDIQSIEEGMCEDNLQKWLLIIGTCVMEKVSSKAFLFRSREKELFLPWNVVSGYSSVRKVYDEKYKDIIESPITKIPNYDSNFSYFPCEHFPPEVEVNFEKDFFFNKTENKLEIKKIIEYLKLKNEEVKLFQIDETTIEIRFKAMDESRWQIVFGKNFPDQVPLVIQEKYWELEGIKEDDFFYENDKREISRIVINNLNKLNL